MRLSYSSIESYKTCPLKYRFQHVDRIKEPKSKEQVFGTLIHSVMRFIHAPAPSQPTLDEALNMFSQNWNGELYPDEREDRAAFSQGVKIIQEYYRKNDPNDFTVVDLESRFAIEIGDDVTGRHVIAGTIDRIDVTSDGYEIIDYKTGKKMPSQDKIDNDLQLSIYLKAFLNRYPKETEHLERITVSLYFLRHGVKLSSTRTREQLDALDSRFLDVIKEIEAEKFEPVLSALCDYCGYQKICPLWKHKFLEEMTVEDDDAGKAADEMAEIRDRSKSDRRRIAELQEILLRYMEQKQVERVFSGSNIVGKSLRKTYSYDEDALRSVLEPLGKWDAVRKVDGIALRGILPLIPSSDRDRVEKAKTVEKESVTLSIKKSKEIEGLDDTVIS
ncbi:MAG: PD-(D/E)XK nuclease family protein [Candidatus Moranbacteria bacterium]|nr:PD-(D/E)XK nuclease family protein [Candidatus Moranbacteria bacterium]